METSIWRKPFYAGRASAHVAFAVVVWPLVTVIGTVLSILTLPYYSVTLGQAFLASLLGLALITPDMLAAGAIVFGLSAFIFGRLGPETRGREFGYLRLGLEPLITFTAISAGASLWYPAMLSAPLLIPVARLPVAGVLLLLGSLVVLAAALAARPGRRLRLATTMIVVGALSPLPLKARAEIAKFVGSPSDVVVLGIDSVSHSDDLRALREWTGSRRGAWYEHAVAPGLLTNAVWSSILSMRPIRSHGVFLTFQRLAAGDAALLAAARSKGFRTVASFSDQLTCMVGSRAGFDDDRSSPVGWRQLLIPIVTNNTFLVPIVRPALPKLPFGAPPNHAGTVTYDVRREVREILRAGSRGQPALVMGHLTYPHLPAYPGSVELSWQEFVRVARAPAGTVFDRSFDWQDADKVDDPLQLHRWKIAHLLEVIRSEVDSSGHLERGGRLVLFSDHGDRANLKLRNFGDPRYHHVLLATFGVPARCTSAPISLADIGMLLQFADVHTDPAVEYMFTPETLVPILVRHAELRWSGDVDIDPALLSRLFKELQRHDPWTELTGRACGETTQRQ